MKILFTKRNDKKVNGEYTPGKWEIAIRESYDYGNTFVAGINFYDTATCEAWNPRVSFINPATEDIIVIWEQHQNGKGAEIYGRKKVSSVWQGITPISFSDGKDSAEPDLATHKGNAYVGWQDYENGNWQIRVQKIN